MPRMLKISEVFRSIQGESTQAGRPCVFVRLSACDLRCRWCDTAYAFHDGTPRTIEWVLDEVRRYGVPLVEVTGGEPLLQPGCLDLLRALVEEGYETMLETGGHRSLEDVPFEVRKIVDVKCPGSGEADKQRWDHETFMGPNDEWKFVIADRMDFDWAVETVRARGLHERRTVLFSAVEGELASGTLADWVLASGLPVRVQVQMHKLFWPAATRGV